MGIGYFFLCIIVTEEHRHCFVLLVISQVAQARNLCVSTIA